MALKVILFLLVCISLPSPRKGGAIRGRTRIRSLELGSKRLEGGERVRNEGHAGGDGAGTNRRARVTIKKDRRKSSVTRGVERKDLSNRRRRKQRRRQMIKLTTENTLLKETDHGDEVFSIEDINTENEKEEADTYIGQGSAVNENKQDKISKINIDEIITDQSNNAKHVVSKSLMEKVENKDHDMLFTTLENFDRKTINELLEEKERKVGDVVLVNGRPAVIRKRILGKARDGKMMTKKMKVQNPKLIKTRPGSFRRAKNGRRRVRVKVRAGQGISVEDIEDQLTAKKADDNIKNSLYNRPVRVNGERKTSNNN